MNVDLDLARFIVQADCSLPFPHFPLFSLVTSLTKHESPVSVKNLKRERPLYEFTECAFR